MQCIHASVHPHACGEHSSTEDELREQHGSSPRLWGTQSVGAYGELFFRFIPTPVGNTMILTQNDRTTPVHPHACGEHRMDGFEKAMGDGSSPRLWGTHLLRRWRHRNVRFIPTPVGNTCGTTIHCVLDAVHPHACGEHYTRRMRQHQASGSSPRLWGTRYRTRIGCSAVRFIPTPVGNTSPHRTARFSSTVHPHACGEHRGTPVRGFLHIGSSPRLWGTPGELSAPEISARFIPTPVGNTPLFHPAPR